MKKYIICCICGNRSDGYGHNAAPVAEGRCCSDCNSLKVIPARIKEARIRVLKKAMEQDLTDQFLQDLDFRVENAMEQAIKEVKYET